MILFGVIAAYAEEQQEERALIEEISHQRVSDDTEKIIISLSTANVPKIFKIKGGKPRLVIDFFDTGYAASIKKITNADDKLIKSVRVGMHKDPPKTRVVADLATEREYNFEVNTQEQDNSLVISFYFEGNRTASVAEDDKSEITKAPQEPQAESVEITEPEEEKAGVSPAGDQGGEDTVIISEEKGASPVEMSVVTTEKQADQEQEEKEPTAKKEPQSDAEQAEERVNQIIANIKDPKPIVADPVLLDVTFESTANDSEMVLFKLNDFYPPIVFGIEKGNPRVVCDFLDTGLASDIRPVIQANGTFVSKIRTARHPHPEKVRVVLDLVPNKNYDLQQVFFKEDNLFVIIISEFEKESVKPLKTVPSSVD